ncbi:MAG: ABC transporter substrate-binding protein [Candidatus Tectomicrobia bacterium]|uniref:ABC transporter substrate-binding protein n=1 Tax=Tectimicrobiota bacterium TaxID=2528274 RepID=A0A932M146_UNCTE|nr:ABC transporter substrate-binding protein [Candidatus Tectomicrobia bacterium]
MLRRILTALIISALIIVPFFGHAQPIRISYGGTSGFGTPLLLTLQMGLFKKHGIDLEHILMPGMGVQALLAREVQFAHPGAAPAIYAALQGADVVMVASYYNVLPYSLVVHENIVNPLDLKGKKVAISRVGGIDDFSVQLAFKKLGLAPKDTALIQVGADAERIAAVRSGAAAATVNAPPAVFTAQKLGLKVLVDLGELDIPYPIGVVVTTRSYLSENRATAKRFLMALVEGLDIYVYEKDVALSVMAKLTRMRDQDLLSKSYDYFAKGMSLVPLLNPTAVENALLGAGASGRDVGKFYDNSVLQELVKEGFIDRIAKNRIAKKRSGGS